MTFLKWLWNVMEGFGRARAAAHFARTGNQEAAKQLMLK